MFRFKVFAPNSIHRFHLKDASYDSLSQQLKQLGLDVGTHAIQYQDDEGDWISVLHSDEWEEALLLLNEQQQQPSSVLKIKVVKREQAPQQKQSSPKRERRSTPQQQQQQSNNAKPQDDPLSKIMEGLKNAGFCPQSGDKVMDFTKGFSQYLQTGQIPKEVKELAEKFKNVAVHFVDENAGHQHTHCPPRYQPHPQQHHGFVCDGCDGKLIGTRYSCMGCRDYDLCETCMPRKHEIHAQHDKFVMYAYPGAPGIQIERPNPFVPAKAPRRRRARVQKVEQPAESVEVSKEAPEAPQQQEVVPPVQQQPEPSAPVAEAPQQQQQQEAVQPEEEDPMMNSVRLLQGMGFSADSERLKALLQKFNQDLRRVVDVLLQE